MKVFVYGTLKRGGGNCGWALEKKGATFVKDHVVEGFKLKNAGYPVAEMVEDRSSTVIGEVWDIGNPEDDEKALDILDGLDRLESVGFSYNRHVVGEIDDDQLHMYVGIGRRWNFENMEDCPKTEEGHYQWGKGRIPGL